jgi:hypothetical protein
MTPKNFNKNNSNWPEVKIFFLYLVKGFYIKKLLGDFSLRKSKLHMFVVVFLCIPAGWESNM